MKEEERIRRSLEELKRLTGLTLELAGDGADSPEAGEKLAALASAYREKYDRTNFIRHLLAGNIRETDLYASAARFHIKENERRVLYVVECGERNAETAEKILKHMFTSDRKDILAVNDERRVLLIRTVRDQEKEEQRLSLSHTIVDTLNTEAMIKVRVGFGRETADLGGLPEAFREACLALEVGRIFYGGETVLHYNSLGIGRLIYDLPEESARLYLRELFGDGSPEDLDEETRIIINAFFDNNLNISETARQLYVHRNTLVYRLEKLHQASGLDLRIFDDAVALKLALMISSSLRAGKQTKGGPR